jgi:hypothetical protein
MTEVGTGTSRSDSSVRDAVAIISAYDSGAAWDSASGAA